MLLYLILLFLVVISSAIVSFEGNKKIVYVFKIVTCLLIAIPAAIRYGIGVDYWSYIDMYNDIARHGLGITEIGFNLLNLWVAQCDGNAQWVIAISAYLTVFLYFKGVSDKKWLVYSVLFILIIYPWFFSTVRQMIAAGFAFYALRSLEVNKKVKTILLCTFAFLFHYSAVIYPLIYIIGKKVVINKIIAITIFAFSFLLAFLYSDILIEYVTMLFGFTKYESYIQSKWFLSTETGSGVGIIVQYLIFILLIFFYPLDTRNINNRIVFNILLAYICIQVLSVQVVIVNRISRGLIFILLPAIYTLTAVENRKLIIVKFVIYFLLISYFLAQLINQSPNLLPYKICFY